MPGVEERADVSATGAPAEACVDTGGRARLAAVPDRTGRLAAALLVAAALASSVLVVRQFGPLAGPGDTQIWEYTGYYLSQNSTLGVVPRIVLEGNQVFYPYGTSSVFQPWGLERDLLYAALHEVAGHGPWLPVYYVLSVLIGSLGAFALARRDLGTMPAFVIGASTALLSFHAISKYPHHYGYTIVHWSVLGFVADFVIVRRVVREERITAQLWLGRFLLLVLSLGQDFTYVAGFGLLSAAVSGAFVAALIAVRSIRRRTSALAAIRTWIGAARDDARASPRLLSALAGATLVAGWLYVPLAFQIARAASAFDLAESGEWWVSPCRLVLPFFPGFNPFQPGLDRVFGDFPEGGAPQGSVGWFLIALAAIGLWQRRGAWLEIAPVLVTLGLCVCFVPPLRTLKFFPWFEFFRVGGRSTTFYPVMLALVASGARWDVLLEKRHRRGLAGLVGLCAVELVTAYSTYFRSPRHRLAPAALAYFDHVRQKPGEAVLDWPFCAVGGNGVGAELCPEDERAAALFTLRRFHEKKVMGQYFGRLHPDQVKPYLAAGWARLIPRRPARTAAGSDCMRPHEWQFFTDFFRLHDFAGINLWLELVPARCAEQFRAAFGEPTASAEIDGIGRVEFFPKPARLQGQVDPVAGARLKLADRDGKYLLDWEASGLEGPERADDRAWRWAVGPQTTLSFTLERAERLELSFVMQSPIPGQIVTIRADGRPVATLRDLPADSVISRTLSFAGAAGPNQVAFEYGDWNHHRARIAPGDPRKLAVSFEQLELRIDPAGH